MGDAAARTEALLAGIRESLDIVHAQIGSMDTRMALLNTAYQQVASQLDLHSHVVFEHMRVMDSMEQRHDLLAQHMAATVEAAARLGGSKAPCSEEEEDEMRILHPHRKGADLSSGGHGAPPGGVTRPTSSANRHLVPDGSTGSGEAGRTREHQGGKVPLKLSFPNINGEFPIIWRDKCLDYFRVCNVNPTMWLMVATMHMEGNRLTVTSPTSSSIRFRAGLISSFLWKQNLGFRITTYSWMS
jgi:hypothetical protein